MTGTEIHVPRGLLEFQYRKLLKNLCAAVAEERLTIPGALSRLANIQIAIAAMNAVLADPFTKGHVQ